ncbi:MAG: hypothetical protein WCS42_09945 [Verrucomicrobiota bacterium]
MASPYWERQTAGLNQGVNNLTSALIRRPQLQARDALYRAEAERTAAQTGEAGARTGLLNTQNQRGQLQLSQALQLSERFKQPGAITQDAQGNIVIAKDAIGDVMGSMAGMGTGANDAASGIAGLMKAQNQPNQFNLTQALAKNKPQVVGPGAVVLGPDGKPTFSNPSAAAGKNEDVVTEEFPGTTSVEGTPGAPAIHHWGLFGGTTDPATPAVPGVEGKPKRTVKHNVPAGGALSSGLSAPVATAPVSATAPAVTPAPAPAAASPAPGEEEMVNVLHPDGVTTGKIPKSKLAKALAAKYTVIP